jgi:hypothetical protein
MALNLALYVGLILLAAWFWPHCAKPALIRQNANSLAYNLVLGVTVGTMLALAAASAAYLAGVEGSAKLWAAAIAATTYGLVVSLGYPRYTVLLRLTGGRQPQRIRRRP